MVQLERQIAAGVGLTKRFARRQFHQGGLAFIPHRALLRTARGLLNVDLDASPGLRRTTTLAHGLQQRSSGRMRRAILAGLAHGRSFVCGKVSGRARLACTRFQRKGDAVGSTLRAVHTGTAGGRFGVPLVASREVSTFATIGAFCLRAAVCMPPTSGEVVVCFESRAKRTDTAGSGFTAALAVLANGAAWASLDGTCVAQSTSVCVVKSRLRVGAGSARPRGPATASRTVSTLAAIRLA